MPNCTFISRTEKSAPGFKAGKDRLTFVCGGNASGDFKLKRCLLYCLENLRPWKGLSKVELLVYFNSNKNVWMTGSICLDYIKGYMRPAIKHYLQKKNLANKALLLVDLWSLRGHDRCEVAV